MKDILETIIKTPGLEARWLNTLSLLEHIGARKIGKTFAKVHPSADVLQHYADETRHAYAFKRLALLASGGEDPGYIVPLAAKKYFHNLDRRLSDWITRVTRQEGTFQNYLLVTSVIERRAMKLYPLYRKITHSGFVRDELKRVIEEESSHRRFIEEECLKILNRNDVPDFEECDQIEEGIFAEFEGSIDRVLCCQPMIPAELVPSA